MSTTAIVDTGPLLAATNADDPSHKRCLQTLQRPDLHFVIPALVIAEVLYFLGTRTAAAVEARFLRSLPAYEIEPPESEDWERMADLVEEYASLPLGGTDASVIAVAERLGAQTMVTLDRRHFSVVRPRHVPHFELLPE